MGRKHFIFVSCFSLLALTSGVSAGAMEIYQWVDENGVTHFSQWAPAENIPDVSQRTLVDEAPEVDPEEDRYAVEQTAKEMEALREEMALKREQRRLQAANSKPVPLGVQPYQDAVDYPYWPSAYPPRPGRPDWRPDRPGRPGGGPGGGNGPRPNPPVAPPVAVPFRRPGN